MLSQLTVSAVSMVEENTHRMMRVDTLFMGARLRTDCGSGSGLDLGGLIGPRSDGFASRIDRIGALLESESRQKEAKLQLLRKILTELLTTADRRTQQSG